MARWDGNTLVVQWFSDGEEDDEAAFWHERSKTLIFDGNCETFERIYTSKPDPETAFQAIKDWQRQG